MKIKHYILSFLFYFPTVLLAQEWNEKGEIEDTQVVIEKDKRIELPRALRKFDKVPDRQERNFEPQLQLLPINIMFELPKIEPQVRVLTMKAEPIPKIYGNYIKAGAGNFANTYADAYFNNKRSQKMSYGARLYHNEFLNGPVDNRNSGAGRQYVNAFGSFKNNKIASKLSLNYQRNKVHFFGYQAWPFLDNANSPDINADSIRRVFHVADAQLSLYNNDLKSESDYGLNAATYFLFGDQNTQEFDYRANGFFDFTINESLKFNFSTDLHFTTFSNDAIKRLQRNMLRFDPGVAYSINKLKVKAAIGVLYESDSLAQINGVSILPTLIADYSINNFLAVEGGLRGSADRHTYRELVQQNPFLSPNAEIRNTIAPLLLYAEVHSKLSDLGSIKLGASIGSYRDLLFFNNQGQSPAAFSNLYDTANVNMARLYAEINAKPVNGLHLSLKGNYYQYQNSFLENYYHRPLYDALLLSRYNIKEKVVVKNNLWLMGGIPVIDPFVDGGDTEIILDPFVRWDIGVEYLFEKRLSVFIDVNNLLNQNFERWNNYPARGTHFRIGGSYHF